MAKWMGQRHAKYCAFMSRVHNFIVGVLMSERSKDKEEEEIRKITGLCREDAKVNIKIGSSGSWRQGGDSLVVEQESEADIDPLKVRKSKNSKERGLQMVDFLRKVKLRRCKPGEEGLTWLEVAIAFEFAYGTGWLEPKFAELERKEQRRAKLTAEKVVAKVRNGMRNIVKEAGNEEMKQLFKPGRQESQPLRGLGIRGKVMRICAVPQGGSIMGMMGEDMDRCLLAQRSIVLKQNEEEVRAGRVKINLKGRPRWRLVFKQVQAKVERG